MTTSSKRASVHFSVRTALLALTGTAVVFGLFRWLGPPGLMGGIGVVTTISMGLIVAFGIWSWSRGNACKWTTPHDFVSVKVDAKWLHPAKSPWIMGPIATLTGVSLTFAPLFLFWCGQSDEFGAAKWIMVPACFAVIYLVPGFYMRLASEVIAELIRSNNQDVESDLGSSP